jgi:hypothetical protein
MGKETTTPLLRLKQEDVSIGFRKREALQGILRAWFLRKGRQISKNDSFSPLPEIRIKRRAFGESPIIACKKAG